MTVSRKDKDKQNKTARTHVAKSRLGPDGITFPTRMDTEIGFIELHAPKSEKGIKASEDMISDERHIKKIANDKFHQYVNQNRIEPPDGMF